MGKNNNFRYMLNYTTYFLRFTQITYKLLFFAKIFPTDIILDFQIDKYKPSAIEIRSKSAAEGYSLD